MFIYFLLTVILPFVMKLLGYKPDLSRAYCGITAYVGSKPADPNIIRLLMVFNQERGDDATGWVVDDEIVKDTIAATAFIKKNTLTISSDQSNFTIIAHDRKKSSGANTKPLAHPFGMYRGGVEKTNYDLVLAMNGTLSNTEEIAKEYGLKYKQFENSDTEILARAMANWTKERNWTKPIEQYDGIATLVFYSPKYPNTLYVWKDKERTLFYWQKSEGEIYVSSIKDSLILAGGDDTNVHAFEDEMITSMNKGKITKKYKLNREPLKTKKTSTYYENTEWEDYYGGGREGYGNLSVSRSKEISKTANWPAIGGPSINREKMMYEGHNREDMADVKQLQQKMNNASQKRKGEGKVYMVLDKYYRNGHPITGPMALSSIGKVKVGTGKDNLFTDYFFVNGYLCENEVAYDDIVEKCQVDKKFEPQLFKQKRLSEWANHLMYPVTTSVDREQQWVIPKKYNNSLTAVGQSISVRPFLSDYSITLTWEGETLPISDCKVCKLTRTVSINDIVMKDLKTIPLLENEVTRKEAHMYLNEMLMTAHFKNPEQYYQKMQVMVWRKNPSIVLRVYFFKLLIDVFVEKNVLSKEQVDGIIKEGENQRYSGIGFMNEMKKMLELWLNKRDKEDEDVAEKWTPDRENDKEDLAGDKVTEEDLIAQSTKDMVNILTSKGTQTEVVIKTIKDYNQIYSRESFPNALYDADMPLDDIMREYVRSGPWVARDELMFYEAVLLGLNDLGMIKDPYLLTLLESDFLRVKNAAIANYQDWKTSNNEAKSKLSKDNTVVVNAETSFHSEDDKDKDAVVPEEWTSEDYDDEYENHLVQIVQHFKDVRKSISSLNNEEKSEKVDKIDKVSQEQIDYLERFLKTIK